MLVAHTTAASVRDENEKVSGTFCGDRLVSSTVAFRKTSQQKKSLTVVVAGLAVDEPLLRGEADSLQMLHDAYSPPLGHDKLFPFREVLR